MCDALLYCFRSFNYPKGRPSLLYGFSKEVPIFNNLFFSLGSFKQIITLPLLHGFYRFVVFSSRASLAFFLRHKMEKGLRAALFAPKLYHFLLAFPFLGYPTFFFNIRLSLNICINFKSFGVK